MGCSNLSSQRRRAGCTEVLTEKELEFWGWRLRQDVLEERKPGVFCLFNRTLLTQLTALTWLATQLCVSWCQLMCIQSLRVGRTVYFGTSKDLVWVKLVVKLLQV